MILPWALSNFKITGAKLSVLRWARSRATHDMLLRNTLPVLIPACCKICVSSERPCETITNIHRHLIHSQLLWCRSFCWDPEQLTLLICVSTRPRRLSFPNYYVSKPELCCEPKNEGFSIFWLKMTTTMEMSLNTERSMGLVARGYESPSAAKTIWEVYRNSIHSFHYETLEDWQA